MYGLTQEELQIIVKTIESFPQVDEAIIFGSRALNRHKKGSDVDIALKGKNLENTAAEISGILNEQCPLPYYFDILDYNQISNADLKSHINRVGKSLYTHSNGKH